MIHPSPAEFAQAARRGNLIPVYREILADADTPVSAYAKLGGGDYSFLLESVVGGEKWAAYSFIGVAPRAVVTITGGVATLRESTANGSLGRPTKTSGVKCPIAYVSDVLAKYKPVEVAGLPRFWGGAVGWFSYDLVRSLEPVGERDRTGEVPEVCLTLTDTVVIFDNLRQTIKVVAAAYLGETAEAGETGETGESGETGETGEMGDETSAELAYESAVRRIDAVIATLATSPAALTELSPPPPGESGSAELRFGGMAEPASSFSREAFEQAVETTKEYILAGDIFQAVLAQKLVAPRNGRMPFDIYRALRVVNPSPYMFHLAFPEANVTGASPETLVRCEGGRLEVRPIAGTRPRGKDADDDRRLAAELKADPKELAEHLMLVDLGRNDVGRVAKTATVVVTQDMEVEHFSHVMHLVSCVEGDLRDDCGWDDVLRASFPAGTLSGAPKIRAMQIIDELEPTPRGIYGGAVGYISYTGNMDLAIAIRTLVTRGDTIAVGVGAGIVADSNAAAEYEETLNKARAVLRAVALASPTEETAS